LARKSWEKLESLGTLGVPLGLGILGKARENLGAALGLENLESAGILGSNPRLRNPGKKTKENLESLGALGLPLGLGILGKTRKNPGASLGLENLKSPGNPRPRNPWEKLGNAWKI